MIVKTVVQFTDPSNLLLAINGLGACERRQNVFSNCEFGRETRGDRLWFRG